MFAKRAESFSQTLVASPTWQPHVRNTFIHFKEEAPLLSRTKSDGSLPQASQSPRDRMKYDASLCGKNAEENGDSTPSSNVSTSASDGYQTDPDCEDIMRTKFPDMNSEMATMPGHLENVPPMFSLGAPTASVPSFTQVREEQIPEVVTTLVIKGIPSRYSQYKLADHLEALGYINVIDFLYVPPDSSSPANARGFAFVNFTSPEAAETFSKTFDGKCMWPDLTAASTTIAKASMQGFEANIRRLVFQTPAKKKPSKLLFNAPLLLKPCPPYLANELESDMLETMYARTIAVTRKIKRQRGKGGTQNLSGSQHWDGVSQIKGEKWADVF